MAIDQPGPVRTTLHRDNPFAAPRASQSMPGEAPGIDVDLLRERLPRYAARLHDDDVHTMDYVVECLLRSIPGLDVDAACAIMLAAHLKGVAVAYTGPLEEAEHFAGRLASYGLTTSVVPA